MDRKRILFIIDKLELQYFELNKLVTSFWLIYECNLRNWEVFITTKDKLALNNNQSEAYVFNTEIISKNNQDDIAYNKRAQKENLNNFDMIMFRPDPPVDMDYIFATYILDYVDQSKTMIINSPSAIRKGNEKLYINNFPDYVPTNITTSNLEAIKEFVFEHGKAVLKPLNKCFGKGVFFLSKEDKNINTIVDMATNSGTTVVMVQKFIPNTINGDKRLIVIGGELYEECVIKVTGEDDFKFNTHNDQYIKKGFITDEEREMCRSISSRLLKDGVYFAGLDVMNGKIIEINLTSPCFFIKEINSMYNIQLEKRIVDYMESLITDKIKQLQHS